MNANPNIIPINGQTPTLDDICEKWVAAKRDEVQANMRRVALEAQIIAITGVKEEGAETHTTEAGRRVTVTGKMTYSADMELLVNLCAKLPETMRPYKFEPQLDTTGLKFLRAHEPDVYRAISAAITVKPAKTSVSIKEA